MAKQRVMVVGGGLAGLAAAMKLAEIGVEVDLMSLTPVKRSHSVCAQGGINSVNEQTRQLGDSEWLHLDDTLYGGAGNDTLARCSGDASHTLPVRNQSLRDISLRSSGCIMMGLK